VICRICRLEPALEQSQLCEDCTAMWDTNRSFRETWASVTPGLDDTPAVDSGLESRGDVKVRRQMFHVVH